MATIIIGAVVLGTFVFVGYRTYKGHREGKGCSGGCCGCSQSKQCHTK